MKYLFCSAFIACFLAASSFAAHACRCFDNPIENSYMGAATVFEGEVVEIVQVAECKVSKKIRVDRVFKGIAGNEIELPGSNCADSSCGTEFIKGRKYIVFMNAANPSEPFISACGGTFAFSENDVKNDVISDRRKWLSDRLKQIQSIDKAIDSQPENKVLLLKTKIESFLYWRDDQQAEPLLEEYLQQVGRDEWAANELMGVFYRLQKPEKILNFTPSSAGLNTSHAISFARFVLGKPVKDDFKLLLREIEISDVNHSNLVFREASFDHVNLLDSNLSGGDFLNAKIQNSSFARTSFSGVLFGRAEIKDSVFSDVDLSGSDLTGASILDSKLYKVNLTNAKLSGVKLQGTLFNCDTIWPQDFDPVAAGASLKGKCEKGLWSKIKNALP